MSHHIFAEIRLKAAVSCFQIAEQNYCFGVLVQHFRCFEHGKHGFGGLKPPKNQCDTWNSCSERGEWCAELSECVRKKVKLCVGTMKWYWGMG